MVEPASQRAVGGVGGAAICPMFAMVHVAPARVSITSGPGAMSVSGDDGPSLGCRSIPGSLRPMSMISPSGPSTIRLSEQSQATAAQLLDREDVPVFGLVETTGDALEGRQITDQVDVGLLPTHRGSVAMIEIVAGQVLEGVMTTLTWGPRVSRGRRRHECLDAARRPDPRREWSILRCGPSLRGFSRATHRVIPFAREFVRIVPGPSTDCRQYSRARRVSVTPRSSTMSTSRSSPSTN